ncbi:CARDB domain-containing protein [Salinarchaeum chitinilyticum]
MASVSVSHLIIFIASMLVAATVAGALVTGVDRISNSVTDRSIGTSEEVRTDLVIISDPGSGAIYNESGGAGVVTVLAKNTGSENLAATADQIDVLVDGRYVAGGDLNVTSLEGDPQSWVTGTVIRVEIDRTLDAGDHRVQLSANGDEEVLRFRV